MAAFGAYSGLQSCATFRNPETNASSNKSSQEGPTYQPYESFWHRLVTDPIGIFTLALAAFTGSMAYSTFKLARATLVAAEAARDGVKVARDEFTATHRPRIRFLRFETSSAGIEDETFSAFITFVNVGPGDAKIIKIGTKILLNKLPLKPGIHLDWKTIEGLDLAGGQKEIWLAESENLISDFIQHAHTDRASLPGFETVCIGCIVYADGAGRERETAFCRIYDVAGARWLPTDECPEYEYAY